MQVTAEPSRHELWTECRAVVRLAVPVTLVQLGMMALGVVDVMMVGHLSAEALAAVSLGHIYALGMMIPGFGALFVLDPLVAQAVGAADRRGISEALVRGIVLAVVLGVVFGILLVAGKPVLAAIAGDADIVPTAYAYATIVALGLPGFFLFLVAKQTLQAMSRVRPVMITVVAANAANVVLNLGFVYGRFGFPELGAVGAGWATTVCRWFMAGALFWMALPVLARTWERPGAAVLRVRPYAAMLAQGLPIGVQMALEVWIFVTVGFLMIRLGETALGGHTVAMNLASISYMIPLGIGAAAATRVGNAIGRRDPAGARQAARATVAIGVLVMLVSAILFTVLPGPLARLYTSDPEVIAIAVTLLPLAGLFQVFDGTQAVACGILRGAGDTRWPMVINLIGYWGLALPAALWLGFSREQGPAGLWWGLTFGLCACAVMLLIRVRFHLARQRVLDGTGAGDH